MTLLPELLPNVLKYCDQDTLVSCLDILPPGLRRKILRETKWNFVEIKLLITIVRLLRHDATIVNNSLDTILRRLEYLEDYQKLCDVGLDDFTDNTLILYSAIRKHDYKCVYIDPQDPTIFRALNPEVGIEGYTALERFYDWDANHEEWPEMTYIPSFHQPYNRGDLYNYGCVHLDYDTSDLNNYRVEDNHIELEEYSWDGEHLFNLFHHGTPEILDFLLNKIWYSKQHYLQNLKYKKQLSSKNTWGLEYLQNETMLKWIQINMPFMLTNVEPKEGHHTQYVTTDGIPYRCQCLIVKGGYLK